MNALCRPELYRMEPQLGCDRYSNKQYRYRPCCGPLHSHVTSWCSCQIDPGASATPLPNFRKHKQAKIQEIHALAAVGDAKQFRRGRDLAAWIGLVPRQLTTGGKPKLLGISKAGNPYLRRLLVHGARSALAWAKYRDNRVLQWFNALRTRVHPNVAVVALANKLARISWALLTREQEFSAA